MEYIMPKGIKQLKDIHSNVIDKQSELQKKSTIYNSERVASLEEAILNGEKPDNACFFHGDSNWRDSGVIFEYTDEELAELEKCANDCSYFVEKYCKVLNSKGRTLIKLRDYQKRLLNVMSGEKWDNKTDTIVPEHPHCVLLQSRQSGKCLSQFTTIFVTTSIKQKSLNINNKKYNIFYFIWKKLKKLFVKNIKIFFMQIKNQRQDQDIVQMNVEKNHKNAKEENLKHNNSVMNNIKLYEIYFSQIKDPTFVDFITYYAYKLNDSKLLKGKLTSFIYKLEHKKFGDHKEKLIENNQVKFQVKSKNGFNNVTNIYRTKAYETWILTLDNDYTLEAADEHLVYSSSNFIETWKFIKDLTTNDYILTDNGWFKVKSVVNTHQMQYMADISITEDDHSYFSNGILSHNTVTTACYIVWYLCFHYDRNAFVCANKGRTAAEIMNKIKEILETLPFFIKPGIVNLSQSRIKFENGCSIKCAAASKSPATGDSIQLLYIDEAALIPPGVMEEYWASVIPTMSSFTNSQLIISSTPRTKGDRFYKIVDGACKGENDFYYQRVDWWEVPGHDEEWAQNQIGILGEEMFNREFGLSFENEGARLISKHTSLFQNKIKQKFIHRDFYSVPQEISDNIIWSPDFDPTYMSYEELYNRRFLLVVDTAQGIEAGAADKKDSDYNVINIFEIEPLSPNKINVNRNNGPISAKDVIQYKQIGIYMDNVRDESRCAEAAKYITFQIFKSGYKDIDNTKILIEINFNGNNWINKFRDHPSFYDNVIIKTARGQLKPGVPVQKMKLQYGFRTTGGEHGKKYYCELGASMMHKRQIIIRQYDDDVNKSSISQLNQFCKTASGSSYMGECCHDDISVTCLFVSIAQESRQFRMWINDWIETTQIWGKKLDIIRNMLQIYVEKEAQISDELHSAFYETVGQSFGKLTHEQKGYGSLMSGNINNNNNYMFGNSIQSGFGNMLPTRHY